MKPDAVVKLGGSLLGGEGPGAVLRVLAALAGRGRRLVVVPGGGPFADAVRAADRRHVPGDSAAHWMAVLAMEQHAHLLCGLCPRAALVASPEEVAAALRERRPAVLAPYAWLRAADPLPHGWNVTSDSIAAWAAARLEASRLVLLKAVDGVMDGQGAVVPEISRAALAAAPEVDPALAGTLARGCECWIVSGRHPERLEELLTRGQCRGTRVR